MRRGSHARRRNGPQPPRGLRTRPGVTTIPSGHRPYMETDCCLLRQTTNRAACNRARRKARHVPATCRVLESAWSPDAPKAPRGVHRSPRGLVLSLLFLVKMAVRDGYFSNGMEEVESSNLSRSTNVSKTYRLPASHTPNHRSRPPRPTRLSSLIHSRFLLTAETAEC